MKSIQPGKVGALLLGIAMGALVFGFALFVMPPSEAKASPLLWSLSALVAIAVACPNFIHLKHRP